MINGPGLTQQEFDELRQPKSVGILFDGTTVVVADETKFDWAHTISVYPSIDVYK